MRGRLTLVGQDLDSDYVLVGDTLAEVQAMLPPGLERSPRMFDDPADVVEIWFSPGLPA